MDPNLSDFESTIDKCATLLPRRALRYLRSHTADIQESIILARLTDKTIVQFLQDAGVHNWHVARQTLRKVLESKGAPEDHPDLFGVADKVLRGKNNPFVNIIARTVRAHIQNVL